VSRTAASNAASIPVVDLGDYLAGGASAERFVETVGRSLVDTGFFAVDNHGVPAELTDAAYRDAKRFFHLPSATKLAYEKKGAKGQRGYTRFGTEHAKDSRAPDLKEFYQVGRTDVGDDHPVHAPYGPNVWPDADVAEFRPTMVRLYQALDRLGATLLEACARYLDEPPRIFRDMCEGSDTIVRVIYYPPVPADAPIGAIRSAAHEDINLITLLSGATSDGLELLRRDGSWLPIHAEHSHIVVDAGDMLQNVTNGLYKSTTHRVVNPSDSRAERFSMPCFIHPRKEVDLTPLPSCVARMGDGAARFQSITAGDYLDQRLREIGLG
jgi:isopenicillin N synthase-like dioxygenase